MSRLVIREAGSVSANTISASEGGAALSALIAITGV